eukprot:PLAT8972.2.p1 GENE.PLAT8972.2~~PLAT8972.2.p1  ORF type:complete len:108 (-),score=33.10 PLAT8972.2:105-407(-)
MEESKGSDGAPSVSYLRRKERWSFPFGPARFDLTVATGSARGLAALRSAKPAYEIEYEFAARGRGRVETEKQAIRFVQDVARYLLSVKCPAPPPAGRLLS